MSITPAQAMSDPNLLGRSFTGEREAWRAILNAAYAAPLTPSERELFHRLSGGRPLPSKRVRELWVVAGRRSDKSHTAAAIGNYVGTIGVEQDGTLTRLAPGERGVVQLVGCDRAQAKVLLNYTRGMLADSPVLSRMLASETADGVVLTNGVAVEVTTNDFRKVRGRTVVCAILDEVAFYRDESSANPAAELYRALMPSLSVSGGMLIGISSPYSRAGLLWDKYRLHFGKDSEILVVQGGTLDFNKTVNPNIVNTALQEDPEAAKAEWLGQFRSDVQAFLPREAVERVVRTSPLEIPHDSARKYVAFTDPAGGGSDEFCIAIGHPEDQTAVVDVVRAMRGTPADIVAEYATLLKAYQVFTVVGDKYGGSWPADEFRRHGIEYTSADKPKAGYYLDLLPAINSERVEIPPDDKLIRQLAELERRTSRAGRDSIDHPPHGHDDRANVVAGVIGHALQQPKKFATAKFGVYGNHSPRDRGYRL